MAITTNFTNLKGNAIGVISTTVGVNPGDDTIIILGAVLPDGTEVTPNDRTTVTVQGGRAGTVTTASTLVPIDADGTDGDIHIKTDTDDLYVKASGSWGTPTDLTGATGDTGLGYSNVELNSDNTITFTGSEGNSDITTGSVKGDKGDAGSGFNSWTTGTDYAQGDTVVSGDTQWRALRIIDDTDDGGVARNTITPVEGDNWSELITRSQDLTGGATTFPITTADTDTAGYVTVTLDENPTPIPGGFPGIRLTLSSDGALYNKFNSTTPIERVRSLLLFTTASGLDIETSGFQSLVNDDTRYQFFRFDDSVGLSAAEIATDLAAEITAGQDCSLANSTENNGETWNLEGTANGDAIELRATSGDNLSAEFLGVNGDIGWVGSNVDPVVVGDFLEVTAGNDFIIGDFVVDNDIVYVCREAYTTTITDNRPVGDATHWKDISS